MNFAWISMEISSFECHLNVHVQNLKVDTMLPGTKAQMRLKTQSTLSTFDDFGSIRWLVLVLV